MDRLTEWRDERKMLAKPKFSGDYGSANILRRLAEYEDLEEKGLLLNISSLSNDEINKIQSYISSNY